MATKELMLLLKAKDLASKSLDKVGKKVDGLGKRAKAAAGAAAKSVAIIGVAAAGFVASQVVIGLKSLAAIETARKETDALLASTKNAAGVTAAQITAASVAWSDAAGREEEDVQHLQNILLTFTGISKDTFGAATEAALNMSRVMGTDLQSSAVLVGKALNDPIRGVTALRRVGVRLSAEQEKQIKNFVKTNQLAKAQGIIIGELSTEFGGAEKAFGETSAGKFERLKQAVQGAQRAIAVAFLPILLKVGDKLRTLLAKPETLKAIEEFGKTAAGAFDRLLSIGEKMPWDAIFSAFKMMGQGAKAALDIFTSMPAWVQTAVVTGWGLNKLTGGALGGIVGELGKGLVKGVLGMNAAVVNLKAGAVTGMGGAAGAAGGGTSKLVQAVSILAIVGSALAVFTTWRSQNEQSTAQANDLQATANDWLSKQPKKEDLERGLRAVDKGISDIKNNPLMVLVQGEALNKLQQMHLDIRAQLDKLDMINGSVKGIGYAARADITGRSVAPAQPKSAPKGSYGLPSGSRGAERRNASGLLGMTRGATSLGIAGEAGKEAVAIIRNPRAMGSMTPNITVPVHVTTRSSAREQHNSDKQWRRYGNGSVVSID